MGLAMPRASVVMMCGLPASGKTTTAGQLHSYAGGALIRSCDVYADLGIRLPDWVARTRGFTIDVDEYDRVRDRAYEEIACRLEHRLQSTGLVILDAVYGERREAERGLFALSLARSRSDAGPLPLRRPERGGAAIRPASRTRERPGARSKRPVGLSRHRAPVGGSSRRPVHRRRACADHHGRYVARATDHRRLRALVVGGSPAGGVLEGYRAGLIFCRYRSTASRIVLSASAGPRISPTLTALCSSTL